MGVMEAMGSSRSSWALSIFEILQLFFQDTFHLRSSTVFWNMFKTSKHICTSTIPRRNNKNLQQPYMFPAILTDCPSDPEKSDILQLPKPNLRRKHCCCSRASQTCWKRLRLCQFSSFSVVDWQCSSSAQSSDFFTSQHQGYRAQSRSQWGHPAATFVQAYDGKRKGLEQTKTRMNQYK